MLWDGGNNADKVKREIGVWRQGLELWFKVTYPTGVCDRVLCIGRKLARSSQTMTTACILRSIPMIVDVECAPHDTHCSAFDVVSPLLQNLIRSEDVYTDLRLRGQPLVAAQ